jgi:hypothetical protein
MPAVHRFLRNVKMDEVPFTTDEEVDAALAQELSDRCFYFQEPLSRGKALFFGMLHLAPELGDHLPLSWRCMKTWEKIYPSEEGYAYPRQVIYASLYYLANKGEFWPFVWVWLSYDCYLRTQDAEALLVDDVCDDGVFISLLLSPRARGLKAKTGSDQGVQIDSPLLTAIIRSICRDLRPGERLFPRDRGCINRAWAAALLSLGLRKPRALHVLRHSGASEDVSSSRRDLEQVRRRGRWSQLKSVARYNKTYMLVKSRAETPAPTLELGDMVEKDLAASLARAACAGGAGKSAHGRAILKALESC